METLYYLFLCFNIVSFNVEQIEGFNALEFLDHYGYKARGFGYSSSVTTSVAKFQRMANIPITGRINHATLKKMKEPRCGVIDINSNTNGYSIKKWQRTDLTYSFSIYTKDLTNDKVKEIIRHAFQIWSDESPLRFREVPPGPSDFNLGFFTGDHLDGRPFDGAGQVLAHAKYPPIGTIHFDDDETWIDGTSGKNVTSLFFVAVHEIGHAIGLPHEGNRRSIMHPYSIAKANRLGWRLPALDRYNLEKIYGRRLGTDPACKDKSVHCTRSVTPEECKGSAIIRGRCEKSCGVCR